MSEEQNMKKILLIVSIISVLVLSGCNTNKDINNDNNQNQENVVNSSENVSGEIILDKNNETIENEHVNPYMEYSPLYYYYTNSYEEYIKEEANTAGNSFYSVSPDELQILRNLSFAKKGHDFQNADLAEFFNNEPWYQKIDGKQVTLAELSSDEQKVLSKIDEQINAYKGIENASKLQYDPQKEIVYSFYTSCTDEYGRKFDFPYININSDNITKLNNDIYNWATSIILPLDFYTEYESAKYKYYLNDDVLTIIIEALHGYGGESGFHFNIDVNTGEFISNTEILQKNGIDIENIPNVKEKLLNSQTPNYYYNTLKEYYLKIEDCFSDYYSYDKEVGDNLLNTPEEWTLVYIDNEGKMHVILWLPTLAGATDGADFVDCIVEF